MKDKKVIVVSLIINILLIGIIYNLLNPNERLSEERQVLKEMNTTEREEELDNKITELSTSATEYATYVQNCKAQIADAITEKGVATSQTDTINVMVENIKKLGSDGIIIGSETTAESSEIIIGTIVSSSFYGNDNNPYSMFDGQSSTYWYTNYTDNIKIGYYSDTLHSLSSIVLTHNRPSSYASGGGTKKATLIGFTGANSADSYDELGVFDWIDPSDGSITTTEFPISSDNEYYGYGFILYNPNSGWGLSNIYRFQILK